MVHDFSGYLLDWLYSGELDIAVVYGGDPAASVRFSPLLLENLHYVSAPGSGLTPHHAIGFAAVAAGRLILPGPQHGLRLLVEAEARRSGQALQVAVEADDLQILKELAMRGIGATILPLAAVHEEVKVGRLAAAPIIDPHLSRKLVVAEPLGRQASNAVRRFGEVLRGEVVAMVQDGIWDGQLLDRNAIRR